uniref:NADH-ubiquinone oxidoreductase chain 5 n=1 Tax=Rectidens sumatrensis TaxID=1903498 RepID=A0A8A3WMX5_9BIVA|nr:NADH dehydrogenase subunit 5 [Rectidens sumatrensis]
MWCANPLTEGGKSNLVGLLTFIWLLVAGCSFLVVFIWLWFVWLSGIVKEALIFEWEILGACGFSLKLCVLMDNLSVLFSCVVCLISGCVFVFSMSYMEGDKFGEVFCLLVVAFVLAMNVLIFVPTLVFVLLGWDLLGIVSFFLVIYYQNSVAVGAGMMTVLMNRVGDVFLVLAIGVGSVSGVWGVSVESGVGYLNIMVLLLVGASMTKSAQVPFSVWLPAAMAAPTPVSALVHSSTLVTVGVYFLFRHYSILASVDNLLAILAGIGCVTLLMGGLGACFEVDVKKLIAFSTLSHLGFMVYTLSLGYPVLSVFHLLSHALFKSLLFLCAGYGIHFMSSSQDIRYMSGVGWVSSPLQVACISAGLSSLCGVPYLSGFYSKDAILEAAISSFVGVMEIFCLVVGAMTSCFYSLRLMVNMVFGPVGGCPLVPKVSEGLCVSIPVSFLSVGGISFGAVIGYGWADILEMFNLSCFSKMMLFFILNFGVVVLMKGVLSSWVFMESSKKVGSLGLLIVWFLSTMWFFRWKVVYLSEAWFKLSVMMFNVMDMGWVETLVGGLGSGSQLVKASVALSLVEYSGVYTILRFSMWLGLVSIVIMSWF